MCLKEKFKNLAGQDWNPNFVFAEKEKSMAGGKISCLETQIKKQNDVVGKLQKIKPGSVTITQEVAKLIELKSEYKKEAGKDWTPAVMSTKNAEKDIKTTLVQGDEEVKFKQRVAAQGDKVRDLKAKNADKELIQQQVQTLGALKTEYKKVFGKDYDAPSQREAKSKAPKQEVKKIIKDSTKEIKGKDADNSKTGTRLGLEAKKSENLPEWYSQVITKGEMIEYYDVSGCYILRPWSFSIWNVIREFFDKEIKKLGVKDCYFPIFVSKAALEREKTHIADFAPEVAWVTKSGESDLSEHIAIRPTSETVMYPAYAKWLKSHRDLPLKLNQWNNVVVSKKKKRFLLFFRFDNKLITKNFDFRFLPTEVGVQTSSTVSSNERISLAGRPHSFCYKSRS